MFHNIYKEIKFQRQTPEAGPALDQQQQHYETRAKI